jgi:hypothetical protein
MSLNNREKELPSLTLEEFKSYEHKADELIRLDFKKGDFKELLPLLEIYLKEVSSSDEWSKQFMIELLLQTEVIFEEARPFLEKIPNIDSLEYYKGFKEWMESNFYKKFKDSDGSDVEFEVIFNLDKNKIIDKSFDLNTWDRINQTIQ